VILVNQQYGLSYKKRYGEVALAMGTHKLHLTVCDTMLWKGDIEPPYTIKVSAKVPGASDYVEISDASLSCDAPFAIDGDYEGAGKVTLKLLPANKGMTFSCHNLAADGSTTPLPVRKNTIQLEVPGSHVLRISARINGKQVGPTIEKRVMVLKRHMGKSLTVVPGVFQKKYDRIALSPARISADGLPLNYFDVKALTPYASAVVNRMDSNDSTRKLMVYSGLLRISRPGMYQFALHKGKKSVAQLTVNNEVLARQRVAAPAVPGTIWLGSGFHSITLQVALGKARIYMKGPGDREFQILGVAALARPATPEVKMFGAIVTKDDVEIFKDERVALSSPVNGARVRYTYGNGAPDKVYGGPLTVSKNATIRVQLFKGKTAIGEVRSLKIVRSAIPMDGLVGYMNCDTLAKNLTPVQHGMNAIATVQRGSLEDGKKGKALGFYQDASRISLRDLATHEDESTLSCWIKIKERTDFYIVTGVPYQSEEYDLRFRGNRFWAEFKRGIGSVNAPFDRKAVEPGKWFHVAASYGDEVKVYLNGTLLNSAQVFNKNMRRGSGRAANLELMASRGYPTNAALDEFRIYDRVLSADEIRALYEADK
jgi:hypothetical protein